MSVESPIPRNLLDQYSSDATDLVNSYKVTPDKIPEVMEFFMKKAPGKPDMPVAFWGSPGVGKTSGVRQYAAANDYRLVVLHLQLYDPTDLKGIPIRMDMPDGEVLVRWVTTSFLPQHLNADFTVSGCDMPVEFNWPNAEFIEWDFPDDPSLADKLECVVVDPKKKVMVKLKPGVKSASGRIRIMEKAIVFLDEISTANPEVQNAALSLVLDRRVNEYVLSPACRVIAAGNTEDDGAFVNEISAALASRFVHIKLVATVNSFLKYAIDRKFDPILIAFLSIYGDSYLTRFNSDQMKGGNYGFGCPRTWENVALQVDPNSPEWIQAASIIGLVGAESGKIYLGFRKVSFSLPLPKDILEGKPYRWDPNADRGTALQMSSLLIIHLKEIYDRLKHRLQGADDGILKIDYSTYPDEWTTAVNSMYKFINNHLTPDSRISAHFMITHIARIPWKLIPDTPEFEKFAETDRKAISEVNAMKL